MARELRARAHTSCGVVTSASTSERVGERAWDFLRPYVQRRTPTSSRARSSSGRGSTQPQGMGRRPVDRRLLAQEPGPGPRGAGRDPEHGRPARRRRRHRRPSFTRVDGSPGRVDRRAEVDEDAPDPGGRPVVTQVSRWDRLKDPAGVIRCFAEHVATTASTCCSPGPRPMRCPTTRRAPRSSPRFGELRASLAGRGARSEFISPACRWRTSRRTLRSSTRSSAAPTSCVQKSLAEGSGSPSPRRCGRRGRSSRAASAGSRTRSSTARAGC